MVSLTNYTVTMFGRFVHLTWNHQLVAFATVLDDNSKYANAPEHTGVVAPEKLYHDFFRFYEDNAKYDGNNIVSNYAYIDSIDSKVPMLNRIVRQFMTEEGANVNFSISNYFDVVDKDNLPRFASKMENSKIDASANSINWRLKEALTINKKETLTFYVKIADGEHPDAYSNVIDKASVKFNRMGQTDLGESRADQFAVNIDLASPLIKQVRVAFRMWIIILTQVKAQRAQKRA